tara:strand:- start:490 stop:693 length:204 start_codon:yes stop_codon:yes gene_type:complete
MNNNRQVSISIKYGPSVYKKNFLEYDSLSYVNFLETFGLWYEINEATDGESPILDECKLETDEKNEQ